jgi:hypothetical protein
MWRATALLLLCSLPLILLAQHSKTEKGGLYTFPYKGDTWTGEIIATDPNTHEITLEYTDKKGQTEKFTATLLPDLKAYVKDRRDQKAPMLNRGDKIIAYYIAIGQKYPVTDEHGRKKDIVATQNLVFEAEVIPPKKEKK